MGPEDGSDHAQAARFCMRRWSLRTRSGRLVDCMEPIPLLRSLPADHDRAGSRIVERCRLVSPRDKGTSLSLVQRHGRTECWEFWSGGQCERLGVLGVLYTVVVDHR